MIRVEVIEKFTLAAFDELKNLKRASNGNENEKGKLYVGDTFECSKEMCEYLTGKNPFEKVVVKIIEVEEVKKEQEVQVLSQSPVEELEKAKNIKAEITTATYKQPKKKKTSKK